MEPGDLPRCDLELLEDLLNSRMFEVEVSKAGHVPILGVSIDTFILS